MSLDLTSRLIVGVRVTRDLFWRRTGTLRLCTACHTEQPGKHCADCGLRTHEKFTEEPTTLLTSMCSKQPHMTPQATWDYLRDDRSAKNGDLCLLDAEAFAWPESSARALVFGFLLSASNYPADETRVGPAETAPQPFDLVAEKSRRVSDAAVRLGLPPAPVEVFCSVSASC